MVTGEPLNMINNVLQDIVRIAESHHMTVRFRRTHPELWRAGLAAAEYVPVVYTTSWLDYQVAYFSEATEEFHDLACVIELHGQWVALWHLSICRSKEGWEITSNHAGVMRPLFRRDCSEKATKAVLNFAFAVINQLTKVLSIADWYGMEGFWGGMGVHLWHSRQMEQGGVAAVTHEMLVDLSWDISAIRTNIRKSYKSLLARGEQLWHVDILYAEGEVVFDEIRRLHQKVAGKITRSAKTWEVQARAFAQNEAFMITLRDSDGALVGGGMFHFTRDEMQYGIGVYERDLFDKPLGHVVQMRAIIEGIKLGLKWYRIGYRYYPGDQRQPSAKEVSIAKFKEGFATHVVTELRVHNKSEWVLSPHAEQA